MDQWMNSPWNMMIFHVAGGSLFWYCLSVCFAESVLERPNIIFFDFNYIAFLVLPAYLASWSKTDWSCVGDGWTTWRPWRGIMPWCLMCWKVTSAFEVTGMRGFKSMSFFWLWMTIPKSLSCWCDFVDKKRCSKRWDPRLVVRDHSAAMCYNVWRVLKPIWGRRWWKHFTAKWSSFL